MRFFEVQEEAKRLSFLLKLLFTVCVVALSAVNAFIFSVVVQANTRTLEPKIVLGFFGCSVAFFVFLSWIFVLRSKSGAVLAEAMGGQPLVMPISEPNEKKLFNIVEEMSIASGVPVPFVFVLQNEHSINAFAAGIEAGNSVIAVTRGAIDNLNRDELQAVIAHEYSHILNQDMKLNTEIAGMVKGFDIFTRAGHSILRHSSRSRSKKGVPPQIVLIGLSLYIIGLLGFFFGRIIQSFISQQREYLADAASAQFTRNPEGLARALAKIEKLAGHRTMEASSIYEYSHIFFAEPVSNFFTRLLSTHPSVKKRIQRLMPNTQVEAAYKAFTSSVSVDLQSTATSGAAQASRSYFAPSMSSGSTSEPLPVKSAKNTSLFETKTSLQQILSSVGAPSSAQLLLSQQFLEGMQRFGDRLQSPEFAKALLVLSILGESPEVMNSLSEQEILSAEDLSQLKSILRQGERARIFLFQMALGVLRHDTNEGKIQILEQLKKVFEHDATWEAKEALLMFNAERVLKGFRPSTPIALVDTKSEITFLRSWIKENKNIPYSEIHRIFIKLGGVPLAAKARLISEIFNDRENLMLNQELLRLTCLALGVPVPPITPSA